MRRMLIALALIGGFMAAADVAVAQYYTYEPGYYPPPPKRYYRERHYITMDQRFHITVHDQAALALRCS